MLSFLVTSDWHLEAMKKHFPEDHLERQFSSLDRIYQYALTKGITHIIIPGDISDRQKMDDETKARLLHFFMKYEGIIESHYIGGNHDWADATATSMDLINQFCDWKFLKSLHVYMKPKQVKIEGITVNMLPHPARASIKSKKPALNFCHVEASGAKGDNGRLLKVKKDIAVHEDDFTISGHLHMYQYLKKKRFLFGGAPYQKTFGESRPKGFLECSAKYKNGKLIVKHDFVTLKPNYQLDTVSISRQKDWSKLEVNPSIRYRVYVDDGVTVPADIRTRIPNIAQILGMGHGGKDLDVSRINVDHIGEFEVEPLNGLKDWLKTSGLKIPLQKLALKEAEKVRATF